MPTLNQRRRETTRLDIAEAALALFARDGYPNVTAEAIAEASEVSLRTFYRYFSAKSDVLRPIVEIRAQRFADALADRPADESLPIAVQRAVETLNEPLQTSISSKPFIHALTRTPDLFTRWLQDPAIFQVPLAPVVQQRMGAACSEEHAGYTTSLIVTALRLAFEASLARSAFESLPDELNDVLAYFAEGAGLAS